MSDAEREDRGQFVSVTLLKMSRARDAVDYYWPPEVIADSL